MTQNTNRIGDLHVAASLQVERPERTVPTMEWSIHLNDRRQAVATPSGPWVDNVSRRWKLLVMSDTTSCGKPPACHSIPPPSDMPHREMAV